MRQPLFLHRVRGMAISLACCLPVAVWAQTQPVQAASAAEQAATLRAQYSQMLPLLRSSAFGKPLLVRSQESTTQVQGEVFSEMDFAFATVLAGLQGASQWCEVMILHINTKYCRPRTGPSGTELVVQIGKKTPEELAPSSTIVFRYRVLEASAEYLRISMSAQEGPLGTSNYSMVLQATQVQGNRTMVHLRYAYTVNSLGRLALNTYLATTGRNKVGFTQTGKDANGAPVYLQGVRGTVERNTMRYYLAIEAFLSAQQLPPAARQEARLLGWFAATEQYPVQLHEVDRQSYLEMKRAEIARQTQTQVPP